MTKDAANSSLILPPPPLPAGRYRPGVIAGDLIFLAGFGPRNEDGSPISGVVGADMDIAAAQAAARIVGLTILSTLQHMLGDLDRVRQVVKITGMVNAVPGFAQHPRVLDGCSDVLVEALGARGEHARAAYGVGSLPFGAPVSIESVVQIQH